MTLIEKFENIEICIDHQYLNLKYTSAVNQCEQIADDYAIEFGNWLFNIDKEILNKQLKEFKKEKGL